MSQDFENDKENKPDFLDDGKGEKADQNEGRHQNPGVAVIQYFMDLLSSFFVHLRIPLP